MEFSNLLYQNNVTRYPVTQIKCFKAQERMRWRKSTYCLCPCTLPLTFRLHITTHTRASHTQLSSSPFSSISKPSSTLSLTGFSITPFATSFLLWMVSERGIYLWLRVGWVAPLTSFVGLAIAVNGIAIYVFMYKCAIWIDYIRTNRT